MEAAERKEKSSKLASSFNMSQLTKMQQLINSNRAIVFCAHFLTDTVLLRTVVQISTVISGFLCVNQVAL